MMLSPQALQDQGHLLDRGLHVHAFQESVFLILCKTESMIIIPKNYVSFIFLRMKFMTI